MNPVPSCCWSAQRWINQLDTIATQVGRLSMTAAERNAATTVAVRLLNTLAGVIPPESHAEAAARRRRR